MRDSHGIAYVVAGDAGKAYALVLEDVNKRDLGFSKDRALHTVELLAEECEYTQCGTRLYVPPTDRRTPEQPE
jgi:hypothetical protein